MSETTVSAVSNVCEMHVSEKGIMCSREGVLFFPDRAAVLQEMSLSYLLLLVDLLPFRRVPDSLSLLEHSWGLSQLPFGRRV